MPVASATFLTVSFISLGGERKRGFEPKPPSSQIEQQLTKTIVLWPQYASGVLTETHFNQKSSERF